MIATKTKYSRRNACAARERERIFLLSIASFPMHHLRKEATFKHKFLFKSSEKVRSKSLDGDQQRRRAPVCCE